MFYDLDTPVTLAALDDARPAYVGPDGFKHYDLVLSYTGGPALDALKVRLGARRVAPTTAPVLITGSIDREHQTAPS